jgi:hypothetical protein
MGLALSCIGNEAKEHVIDIDQPLPVVKAKSVRENKWTFPLPVELMGQICDILSNESALRTLATLQEVSSCSYTLATPFLYRHIIFDARHAILFLDLFNKIPKSDRDEFLKFKSVKSGSHLLNQKFAIRLRSVITYTQSLSFIPREDTRLHYHKGHKRLKGFNRFQSLLDTYQERNPLWPNLQRCHLDLSTWPCPARAPKKCRPSRKKAVISKMSALVNALFLKECPEHMSIIIAARNPGYGEWDRKWCCWTCIENLHAAHIGIAGLNANDYTYHYPRAGKSLTLRFDRSICASPGWIQRYGCPLVAPNISIAINRTGARDPMYQIGTLVMIGLIKPNEYNLKHTYGRIEEELMITIRRATIQLMQERLKFGNQRDFRISIMPDSSLESAANAVWYTFKVPEAV